MDFRTLGPVEVTAGGRAYAPSRPMHRALLGLLLLDAGQVVSVQRLVDRLWPDQPPAGAVRLVHNYASRLRKDLAGGDDPPAARLVTRRPGYVLLVDAAERDAARFDELARGARTAAALGDLEGAARTAAAALTLWRGRPYGDVPGLPAIGAEADRLEETRLATVELRIEAELATGRDAELVGELAALVETYPLRERLSRLLMTALHRAGRQAEALAAYRAVRDRLVAEVGVEPGPELRHAHAEVLAGVVPLTRASTSPAEPATEPEPGSGAEPGPAAQAGRGPGATPEPEAGSGAEAGSGVEAGPREEAGAGMPRRRVPAQLPPDVPDFTGRAAVLAEVLAALDPPSRPPAALPVVAVSGPAGVGKTALAVHAAHLLRDRYPDGQLSVTLRGAEGPSPAPADVLGRFLRALGVDPQAVPAPLDERLESYRTLVADRRLLVVLDDAAGEAQVRPLLPGGAGCGVLVTSRGRLAGLAGARPLDLDLLSEREALDLLSAVAGAQRVHREPDAAQRTVRACGRLPLAVRIAGAKLAAAPHWTLRRLADQLADERRRMDHLVAGDLDVRASFRLSYRQLTGPQQRAFRRLGLLGLPEFDAWVLAALLDAAPEEADAVLRGLLSARLVDVAAAAGGGDRYRVHDLLRAYAGELAAEEPEPERRAAVTRVLGGWLTLAEEADRLLPYGPRPGYRGPAARRPAPTAQVRADPVGWFGTEQSALLAAVELAVRERRDETAWALAAAAGGLLDLHQNWEAWHRVAELGLAAAVRTGDRRAEVLLLVQLGTCEVVQGSFAFARARLEEAQARAEEAGYGEGAAHALFALASAHRVLGDLDASLECALRARAAFAALGDRRGQAYALLGVGAAEARQGRLADSADHLGEALRRMADLGDQHGQAQVGAYLGTTLRQAGKLDLAAVHLSRSRRFSAGLGDVLGETVALRELAACHTAGGRPERAVPLLEEAYGRLAGLGHRLGEAFVLLDLGAARRAAGRPAEAAPGLRRAEQLFARLDLPPRRAAALALLAQVEADLGDQAAALGRAREALRLDPANVEAQALQHRLDLPVPG